MKWNKANISIAILIIFHAVGIGGIGFQLDPEMKDLSWMNLLLTGLLVIINISKPEKRFWIHAVSVFILGLTVEIIGVATGFPFGEYHYGDALGLKIMGVPWVLGLNWWLLVYTSIQLSNALVKNKWSKMFLAPALMVAMDFLIEPLCATLDFWYWKAAIIPTENFISWYIIAFLFVFVYYKWMPTAKNNTVGIAAFAIQVAFFGLLNILL